MGPAAKLFLQSLARLVKNTKNIKLKDAYKNAEREFGELSDVMKSKIDDIFKNSKAPSIKKPEKKSADIIPFPKKKEGIMATDEGSATLDRIQEVTEKLKEDPKLQELLRNMGVEDAEPLDSAASVRTALKNMEDRMRVGNNESNIRATLREFLERRLKDGTLNIPDSAERDAIEKVYQGGVDPIEVFRKAYGEDALIAVDDVFEQYGDKIMRESNSYKEIGDKFEKLFKFNRGFYEMGEIPIPKKDYGYDPGLMSNKEFADKLRKNLKEKEMLEDFDPTDRTKNAQGGMIRNNFAIGSLPKGIQTLVKSINKKFGKGAVKTADEIDQPEKAVRQQIMEFEARNKPDAITMESREILDVPEVPKGFKLNKKKLMDKFPEIDEDFANDMMDMDKDTQGRIIKMLENRRLDPEAYDRLLEKYGDTLEFQAEFDKVVRRKNNNQGGLNYLMGM